MYIPLDTEENHTNGQLQPFRVLIFRQTMYAFYHQTIGQMKESLIAAGVDRVKIDMTKRMGTAYKCSRCRSRDKTKHVNIRCRIRIIS